MDPLDDMDCFEALEQFLSEPLNGDGEEDNVSLGNGIFPVVNQEDEVSETTPKVQNPPFGGVKELNAKDGGMKLAFPLKLHDMVTNSNMESILSWLPHGRAFMVHDTEKFVTEVLPKYFSQYKFPTFQKQLTSFGFRRFSQGRDAGAYYHESFLKGRPHLCTNITRIKGKLEPIPANQEINFYALPFIDSTGSEMRLNFQTPVPTNNVGQNHRRRRSKQALTTTDTKEAVTNSNEARISSDHFLQTWKEYSRVDATKRIVTPPNKVTIKTFPPSENKNKMGMLPRDAKMPKKISIDILPLSNHPFDQVTFFIPLDMLLNSAV